MGVDRSHTQAVAQPFVLEHQFGHLGVDFNVGRAPLQHPNLSTQRSGGKGAGNYQQRHTITKKKKKNA